jgi:DNA-binding transcriptional LysR family regulator
MQVDTLTSIKAFRQVVESGSFVAAAERMDLSNAMVSKHVMYLERRLGVRLLNRNSRTLSLTEPGRVYLERCRSILNELEAAELELGSLGSAPRGTLRITAPTWLSGQRLANLLMGYRQRFPEVLVDISFEDRDVDLVEEGFDLAFRLAAGSDSLPAGLVARPLRAATFYLAGSRDYLARTGVPHSPEDLASHCFVAVGNLNSLSFVGPSGTFAVPIRVALRYRSMAGVANAIAAGIGLAPVSAVVFDDPVFNSVLVPVLPEYPLRQATVYFVYVSRKYVPLKIRSFIDFMVETVARLPDPTLPSPSR